MHDTRHYREYAARCEELAEEGSLPISIRELYRDIAARWLRLADDVDRDAQRDQRQRDQSQQPEFRVGSTH